MVNLLLKSTHKIYLIKSLASVETNLGIWKSAVNIFLYNNWVSSSSKGKYPHSRANIITPQLHISVRAPSYYFPAIISGAA